MQFVCVFLLLGLQSVTSWDCSGENCDPKWRREIQENSLDLNGEREDVAFKRNLNPDETSNGDEDFDTDKRHEIKNPYQKSQLRNPFRNRKLGLRSPARLIRELSNKRGSLERNFLRFGRSDQRGMESLTRNFLRFGRSYGSDVTVNNHTQLRKLIDNIRDKMSEPRDGARVARETINASDGSAVDELSEAIDELKSYLNDELHDGDKRAALDRNFLRFGKSFNEQKRPNSLEKNFLRFGRSAVVSNV